MKKTIIFSAFIAIILVSCKTSYISVDVLKPAHITVPTDIQTIVVANRYLPKKDEQVGNVVEGLFSGESMFMDRDASYRCIEGVGNYLAQQPRYKVVKTNREFYGTGGRSYPPLLSWHQVEEVCNATGADALITLDVFDSDFRFDVDKQERRRKENDRTITYIVYQADLDVSVTAGWRIYDYKNKRVIDQSTFTDHKYWNAEGDNEQQAKGRLPRKENAINEAGFYAGQQFAARISPVWVTVSRKYYTKGNDDFIDAKYAVRINDWKKAIEHWKKYTEDPDPKIAGYACYNMALASEVTGSLQTALDWASKAYNDYHLKTAGSYMNILKQRIKDQERLKKQLAKPEEENN